METEKSEIQGKYISNKFIDCIQVRLMLQKWIMIMFGT